MARAGRALGLLLLAALLCAPAAGCLGLSSNPSYFPYLLPTLDVIPTHAKPIWPGNDANFDPQASTLVIMPIESTSKVRAQHVLLATVYDPKGQPLRNRRVEWKIEGVGNIIEVDEHGVLPGRGFETGKYGVSYTRWCENRITRGNSVLTDDFMVRPGQTYCVLTSPIEGDTHVTAYAPGIYDWDKRVVHTTIRWVDVHWEFPPRAVAKFGSEHVFTTRVSRFTDRRPLQGYEVRYKILDGPPAFFLPSRTQEVIVKSNADGDALARIVQSAPGGGVNRISVDLLRPPDPSTPSGSVVPIASGETSVEWLAPNVTLSHTVAPTVALNQEVVFTTTVNNIGRVESRAVTVVQQLPDGLKFARSNPPVHAADQLVWTLASLAPGQSYTIQTVFVATRPGPVTSTALMATGEGQKDQKQATTQVTVPDLKIELRGPQTAVVNMPVTLQITVSNPGSGALDNVQVEARFDEGLQHASGVQVLTLNKDGPPTSLAPQQSQTVELVLTPRKKGLLGVKVTARAGTLVKEASLVLTAAEPKLSVDVIEGPQKRVAGRPGEWKIRVANEGDVALTNVTVRDRLPAELEFDSASDNGAPVLGEVTWNLGTMAPRSQRVLVIKAKATKPAASAVQIVAATADPGLRQEAQKGLEIVGLGAMGTNLIAVENVLEIGKIAKHQLEITNTGSAPIGNIVVKGVASAELKPTQAAGPGGAVGVVQGQTIAFARYDGVPPGAKIVFTFEGQALKAGDARLVLTITSDVDATPLTLQQSTRIVAPLPLPGNAPPPPPAGGVVNPLPPE
jgi:uncharacterized repeat protein (TIGR01451 family)